MDTFLQLQNSLIPYVLIILGILFVAIGLGREQLAWMFSMAPDRFLRFLPLGAALTIFGFVWIVLPSPEVITDLVASTPEPTEMPPPFVTITAPQESLPCSGQGNACRFEVSGQAGGLASFDEYRIYTFVLSTDPRGPGYFLQPRPAGVQADGRWVQPFSFFGDDSNPSVRGQTLEVRAALVRDDATYFGTPLGQLSRDFYLASIQDLDGLVVVSEPVALTVER